MEASEVKLAHDHFQFADQQWQIERRQPAAVCDIHQQDVVKHAQERERAARRRRLYHPHAEQLHYQLLCVEQVGERSATLAQQQQLVKACGEHRRLRRFGGNVQTARRHGRQELWVNLPQ